MENDTTPIQDTLHQVADLYGDNLRQHGVTSKSVGWKDETGQRLRFDQLLTVVRAEDWAHGFTVNDLGTGYGALYGHLFERGARVTGFHGYDISPEMLEAAKAGIGGPRVRLTKAATPTEVADYSFASGIFNVRFASDDAAWTRYVEQTIMALAASSRKGFAFNALTSFVDWNEPHLFYADPARFFGFCKRNCSRFVNLLHDTPLYEWTITVRKEGSG